MGGVGMAFPLPETVLRLLADLPIPCGSVSGLCLGSSDSSSASHGTRILRMVIEFK